jgi:hypothetical protein
MGRRWPFGKKSPNQDARTSKQTSAPSIQTQGTPSKFLKVPCSCSGNNPNCFKCGGWGYIDAIGEGRASAGPTGSPRRVGGGGGFTTTRRASGQLHRCLECGAAVRRIARHMRNVHGQSSVIPATAKPSVPPKTELSIPAKRPRLELCPLCTLRVRRLDIHLAKNHPGQGRQNPKYRGAIVAVKKSSPYPSKSKKSVKGLRRPQ